jgi:hypothetical protein
VVVQTIKQDKARSPLDGHTLLIGILGAVGMVPVLLQGIYYA